MSLFVLAETPAGYGLFKAADKKLLKRDELTTGPTSSEQINEMLKLKSFVKFDSSAVAVEEAAGLKEGRVPPMLANLLKEIKDEKKATLAVADLKLGTAIGKLPDLDIKAVSDAASQDLFRAVRENLSSLIPGLSTETMDRMALGLSHSISRHKLKFSADKVDAMVVQAIKLVDDLDKELNVYAMRTKEWYGWHFPELAKILNDNLVYARLVVAVGMRQDFAETDLSDILPEELEGPVKTAAEISMGTEMTPEDLENIQLLAQQVITYSEYRTSLSTYLETRMRALAPNLTALVGYLVGARLIAHAGSLIALAKAPSSTIQIYGAEKALFRALKTKHDTPKYGIIYHSSLVGQATGKNKGKIARSLAAKTALGLRVDALGDTENQDDEEERSILGLTSRIKLENLLRKLEGKPLLPKGVGVGPDGQLTAPGGFSLKESRKYNADADGVETEVNGKSKKLIQVVDEEMKDAESEDEDAEMNDASEEEKKSKKDKKKEKKEKKRVSIAAVETPVKESKAVKGTPAKLSEKDYERFAEAAGISVSKFKRKFERGDVQLGEDGTPVVFSKKELKKLKKAEDEVEETPVKATDSTKKKRKHEDDETPKKEKKLKKKRSSLA
ncbi:NOSIC domain-containing protein [Colletotrichum scovillei]|uniref:Nucleolar protein 58 n=3 Tax=Colletotrichum acutatum species complex TaxID=2707335 RepID=A0A9P7RA52_9PEZI|nr:NOSIC domain-containing protein [Colletotrichum scovillei]KXH41202.1 NOSIC domain-containing protein [Colletotrichum simmondsii]KXH65195.1 NOSIC domain-containing protein [Colletotrichum nymphaeae SA-01]KAF4776115.1 NOSIC domain-containing protein [Colletotrichum scovillei]KAG7053255.1 NOSIC domain-containing protein [Colletotrichum scovillei]KAG7071553.1 NOSIC domain-containing protein [Colletotrichum scovillei]